MSVITTLSIPAEDFTLGAALSVDPGISLRMERVVPVGDTFIPYFWASDHHVEAIESALQREGDIDAFTIVDETGDDVLVRVDWAEGLDGFLATLVDARASILEAVGERDRWRFQLRFDDHDTLTEFYRSCTDRGIDVEIESVHAQGIGSHADLDSGLTLRQQETLRLALDRGYFDVPRRINLVELAEELGISDSAVSQRLRRGIESVLGSTLADAGEEDPIE